MADQFIYCPQCGSKDISDADYEDDAGEPTDDLFCEDCGWEGTSGELVCEGDEDELDRPEARDQSGVSPGSPGWPKLGEKV